MGVAATLLEVCEALAELIRQSHDPPLGTGRVTVGAPREDPTGGSEEVILTPLYVSPSPAHRNHGYERAFDGSRQPPPPTLLVAVVVTTYGAGPGSGTAPTRAVELMGHVAQTVHATPRLDLEALGFGTGKVGITHVTVTPELMDQVFGVLGVNHRSWVLLHLDPVQLVPLTEPEGPEYLVLPGQIGVETVVSSRPVVSRLTPPVGAETGYLRLDGAWSGVPDRLWFGGHEVPSADISVLEDGAVLRFQVPAAVTAGVHRVTLVVGGMPSEGTAIRVVSATERTLDAPADLAHSTGTYTLTGRALADVTRVIAWPDRGVLDPSDLHEMPVSSASSSAIVFDTSGLAAGQWRFAAATADPVYTPHVLLELT